MKRVVQAGVFKAQCLKIMDQVKKTNQSVIITKHHQPIAKLVPIQEEKATLFGKMKGTIQIKKDLIEPIDEEWNANL